MTSSGTRGGGASARDRRADAPDAPAIAATRLADRPAGAGAA
jgi:hypothetical protein